jgi:hypothetical protein
LKYVIHNCEAVEWLKTQPDCSFDAYFSDGPYGYSPDGISRNWDQIAELRAAGVRWPTAGIMSRRWDAGVPGPSFWKEVLRVLKPGAPILNYGGDRTYHRMVCALEDAGAEIGHSYPYIYGQGMPHSYNISLGIDKALGVKRKVVGERVLQGSAAMSTKEKGGTYAAGTSSAGRSKVVPITEATSPEAKRWKGYGTALRPSVELCVLAWKRFDGTIVHNVLTHGVGGLNIEGCQLESAGYTQEEWSQKGRARTTGMVYGTHVGSETKVPEGRWPPNLAFDRSMAAVLDETVGDRPSTLTGRATGKTKNPSSSSAGQWFGDNQYDGGSVYADSGGPSRFFKVFDWYKEELEFERWRYQAKVSRWERDFGCEHLPLRKPGEVVGREDDSIGINNGRAGAGRSGNGVHNHHSCLKSIDLNQWLAGLILPPPRIDGAPRRLLNIFAGSGSEAIGAIRAGWDEVVCVEREAEYIPALEARLKRWSEIPIDMSVKDVKKAAKKQAKAPTSPPPVAAPEPTEEGADDCQVLLFDPAKQSA